MEYQLEILAPIAGVFHHAGLLNGQRRNCPTALAGLAWQ